MRPSFEGLRLRHRTWARAVWFWALAGCSGAWAFGAAGHQAAGRLTESLLEGTPAAQAVRGLLLPGERLAQAAVWLDCVRNVRPRLGFRYQAIAALDDKACAVYGDSDAGRQELEAFAQRNHDNCDYRDRPEECHRSFHFTNVPIQLGRYDAQAFGAGPADIVHGIRAAVAFLRDGTRLAPFRFGDGLQGRREALRMLIHLVGDLHQPMHVGSLYLSAEGKPLNPSETQAPKAEIDNFGGNLLKLGGTNLHSMWDGISEDLAGENLKADAALVALSAGPADGWPGQWAGESIQLAQVALRPLRFGAKGLGGWPTTLEHPALYERMMRDAQRQQVIKAGARLAALLKSIWP